MQQLCYFKLLKLTLFFNQPPFERVNASRLFRVSSFISTPIFQHLHVSWISGCKTFDAVHAWPRQIQRAKITPRKALTFIPQKSCTWPISTCHSLPTVFSPIRPQILQPSLSLPLSISISISLDWKLGLFGFIRYVLEAGRQPLQPFRPPPFLFLAKSDFNRSHSVFTPCFPTRTCNFVRSLYFPRIFISSNSRHLSKGLFFSLEKKERIERICSFFLL